MRTTIKRSSHGSLLLIIAFAFLFIPLVSARSETFSKYVGESFILPIPSSPSSSAIVSSWSYSCTNSRVRITNGGSSEPSEAVITSYFSGSATIECYYSYVTYINGYPHGGTGTQYHTISCKSNDITISAPKRTMKVGETMQMSYSFRTITYGMTPNIEWEANSNAAYVDWDGKVTAVEPGNVVISASSNLSGNIAQYAISVSNLDPTKITIPSQATVYVGESSKLKATLYPSDAQSDLSWYSSSSAIATVSDGTITGNDQGNATVYCVSSNGVRSNDCQVNVIYRTATGVKISSSTLSAPIGESRTIPWSLVPSNARAEVTWRVEDPSIASVSQSGVVTGINQGSTTVHVNTDNGYEDTCAIVVPPDPSQISLPNKVSLYMGRTRSLRVTPTPADAYYNCSWTSSNTAVADVSSSGQVTAYYPGNTVITATSQNGKEAKCSLEVPEPSFTLYLWPLSGEFLTFPLSEKPKIKEKDGSLSIETSKIDIQVPTVSLRKFTVADAFTNELPSSIALAPEATLGYHEHTTIGYTFQPQEYDIETTIHWETSDPRIATVTSDGDVYGCHPGNCDIIATTSNGKSSVSHVTVLGHDAYLVLWQWSGEKVAYHLDTYPRVKHDEGQFMVISDEAEVCYPDETVRKFTLTECLEDEPDGMNDIFAEKEFFGMTLSKARPGSIVSLYTIEGKLLETLTVGSDGIIQYSLDNQPVGVYIIKTESTTIKIYKK